MNQQDTFLSESQNFDDSIHLHLAPIKTFCKEEESAEKTARA
jgi:hypothetical protein